MRSLILTLGTRGDLELFRALGLALAERGHDVTIASSPFHAAAVESCGIRFLPVGTSTQEDAVAALRSAGASDDLIERTRRFYVGWLKPQLGQALKTIAHSASEFDVFVSNLKIVLQRRGRVLPCASVTYDPPLAIHDLPRYGPPCPEVVDLVALNQQLIDPDGRWGARYRFTGFWQMNNESRPLTTELSTFLDAGPPPVVVTLGSMAFADAAPMVALLRDSLSWAGQRGVIVRGWSQFESPAPDNKILVIDEAPYDQIFPRAAAIVHHGGVGTAAAALAAARPSVILPQIACQKVFAELLLRAGVSAGSLAPTELTAERLAALIESAVREDRYRQSAAHWRDVIARDRGPAAAAEAIEDLVENQAGG